MHDVLSLCLRSDTDHGTTYAAALARMFGGSLSALVACEPVNEFLPMTQPVAAGMLTAFLQERLAQARAAAGAFHDWTAKQGLARARWLVAHGPVAGVVAHACAWHDLLVLPAQATSPFGTPGAIGRLLLAAGVPTIVVPEGHVAAPSLDVVAVAWNGSSPSTRALHAALPLLRRARRVVLLAGRRAPGFDAIIEPPPFEPDVHLSAHGVPVELCLLDQPMERGGDELLERAHAMRADLLVMGAWGRTRASELLLGGATRHVLQAARLPVLLRH